MSVPHSQPPEVASLYGGPSAPKRIRIHHLLAAKERGERWPMLTSYDQYTAAIFDEAGIPVLLVGDSPPTTCTATRPHCR
jgi:Ketopantoate hydroxymethyltransferase